MNMNKVAVSADATKLDVWTTNVNSVYQLIGEAEDDGLKLDVDAKRSWFRTKLTARIDLPDDAPSTDDLSRFRSLVRRIQHIGLPKPHSLRARSSRNDRR